MFDSLQLIERFDEARDGKRKCVYTAVFGGYDEVPSPTYKPEGWNFICFSDVEIVAPGWEVRVVDPGRGSPMLNNRHIKILPYEYLREFDVSLYIDSNILILGDVSLLYKNWLRGVSFAAWMHPDRSDVYEECEAILLNLRHPTMEIIGQYAALKHQEAPKESGLIEASMLWRDLKCEKVKLLMEGWWEQLNEGKGRDQPYLGFLMERRRIRPKIFPSKLGTVKANQYFYKLQHKKSAISLYKALQKSHEYDGVEHDKVKKVREVNSGPELHSYRETSRKG